MLAEEISRDNRPEVQQEKHMTTKKPSVKAPEAKIKIKLKGSPQQVATGLKAIAKKK